MQLESSKSSLILENSYRIFFTSENYETSFIFFSRIMLYLMMPSLKLFEYLWTHFGAYLLVETLIIYYNQSMFVIYYNQSILIVQTM